MTIRIRFIVLTALFAILAAAAAAPKSANYVGAGICGVAALAFLIVGIWDSGREDRYYLKDDDG